MSSDLSFSPSAIAAIFEVKLLCDKTTPLGLEVEPDEYSDPKMFLMLSLKEIIEGNMEEQAIVESA